MREIKLYRSRKLAARAMLRSLCFNVCMFGGIYLMGFPYWISWLFFIAIGLSSLIFFSSLFHFFDKRPAIIINEIGIANRRNKYGMVNWEIIKDAYIYGMDSTPSSIIYFKIDWRYDPSLKMGKWKHKMAQYNKSLGHEVLKLIIEDIDVDKHKLLLFIKQMIKLNKTEKKERQKMIENWKAETSYSSRLGGSS